MWVKLPNGTRERDTSWKMIKKVSLIVLLVKEEIFHPLFRPTMWWNYSVRRWAGRSHYHLWPVRILCPCSSSDGWHQGKPTLLSVPGSFHSPMPTPAWSSLLLDHADHVVPLQVRPQQQGLEIFTGSLHSPVANWPWGPEPRTDFWVLLDLVPFVAPSDQTPPF